MKKISILTIVILFTFSLSNLKAQTTGTFEDSRDGKTYKTVQIGEQVWFAENLAFKSDRGCWAYDNNEKNASKYGYLYTWKTAQNICPNGWHLPSDEEWTILTNYLGGENVAGEKMKIADTTQWNYNNIRGTNTSGFSALPGGNCNSEGAYFNGKGSFGYWWNNSSNSRYTALYCYLAYDYDKLFIEKYPDKSSGFSVRCIKN